MDIDIVKAQNKIMHFYWEKLVGSLLLSRLLIKMELKDLSGIFLHVP